MNQCLCNGKEPVFSGKTKKLVGYWCPICQQFEKPIARENLITIEWWIKSKKKLDEVTNPS